MAITTGSFAPEPDPRADADARAPYVDGSATRMKREAGITSVASDHTSSTSGESAIGAAFIGETHQWTKTPGKQASAAINGQGSGFPGLAHEGFAEPIRQVLP